MIFTFEHIGLISRVGIQYNRNNLCIMIKNKKHYFVTVKHTQQIHNMHVTITTFAHTHISLECLCICMVHRPAAELGFTKSKYVYLYS